MGSITTITSMPLKTIPYIALMYKYLLSLLSLQLNINRHMLFMGTDKYPIENEYSKYLTDNGGGSNAYTSEEYTVYYFDILPDFLEPGLDRFSSFFTCPLFNVDSVDREMQAVDSENAKNLQQDMWRQWQLFKSLARSDHPLNGFSTGNLTTLKTIPESVHLSTRELMVQFYNSFYSSNIMTLVIYGKEDLDTLEMYASKFNSITNKNYKQPSFPSDPYTAVETGCIVEVVPIKDIKKLEMSFPMKSLDTYYRSKPVNYISYLLGHESEGSILFYLKQLGYANDLSCYPDSYQDFAYLSIKIVLTDEGVANADEVIGIVFTYIGLLVQASLSAEGLPAWIAKEIQLIQANNFKFQSKYDPQSYVVKLGENMQLFNTEHILNNSLIFDVDLELVTSFLQYLTPENCIVMICSKDFVNKTSLKEKYYDTDYNHKKFDSITQLSMWNDCIQLKSKHNAMLYFPVPNTMIASDFSLKDDSQSDSDGSSDYKYPILSQNVIIERDTVTASTADSEATPGVAVPVIKPVGLCHRLWYLHDTVFKVPKAVFNIQFQSQYCIGTVSNQVATELFTKVLLDNMNAYLYYSKLAGLYLSISRNKYGFDTTIYGYNEKIHVLLDRLVEEMLMLSTAPVLLDKYNRIKQKLLEDYNNLLYSQAYSIAIETSMLCLEEPRFSIYDRYDALFNLTIVDFQSFACTLLKSIHVEVLMHGNCTRAEASKLTSLLTGKLKKKPLSKCNLPYIRNVQLTPGCTYVSMQHSKYYNEQEANSAIENIYICCNKERKHEHQLASIIDSSSSSSSDNIKQEAYTRLLVQLIKEPAFDNLRTKQQLGYIVSTNVKDMVSYYGVQVVVQSSNRDAKYLDDAIELFLASFYDELALYTNDSIQSNINATIEGLLEKPKNLSEEASKYWNSIISKKYLFNSDAMVASYLQSNTITVSEVLDFYSRMLLSSSNSRRKFSSQYYGKDTVFHEYSVDDKDNGVVVVAEPIRFRRSMSLNSIAM